jgi:hypothetical protein
MPHRRFGQNGIVVESPLLGDKPMQAGSNQK